MAKKNEKVRHVLPLSGGKDSAALAVYLMDKIPDLEYVFLDTGHELPETYAFLNRIRAILGIDIKWISPSKSFEDMLKLKGNYLPSPQKRWCTQELKIKPYERYIGTQKAYSYIGIRADEDRDGYMSGKRNIIPMYPFIEDGISIYDVQSILEKSGLGYPEYYTWRSRSGCYFCFFQQKTEWINLYYKHKELFLKAMSFEKNDTNTGKKFTWCQNESLSELLSREKSITEKDLQSLPIKKCGKKIICRLSDVIPEKYPSCVICE